MLATTLVASFAAALAQPSQPPSPSRPPNVVVVFTDDQGYGDLECYGHPVLRTPHLDRLAASGVRLTQFYAGGPVCTPSRAALLTGCYPVRVGLHQRVIYPDSDFGLHPEVTTVAELLRTRGYTNGCFGKWHLGHRRGLMPTDQGFDEFYGVPYSNDMAQAHRAADDDYPFRLPLMRGDAVVEWEPDQRTLTQRYTDAAIAFMQTHCERPFFVYLAHSMPHVPLFVDAGRAGRSPAGLYGDVIEAIDDSVGRILAVLDDLELRQQTVVWFASDNGPARHAADHGGCAGPLRGGKGTVWEGGLRVPCLVSWPGVIPAGTTCRAIATAMDFLPTVAGWAGATHEATIDGHDIGGLLAGTTEASPTSRFLYYDRDGELAGIRLGAYKLLLEGPQLYHLERDVGERRDLAGQEPALVETLRERATKTDRAIRAAAHPTHPGTGALFSPAR